MKAFLREERLLQGRELEAQLGADLALSRRRQAARGPVGAGGGYGGGVLRKELTQ